MKNRKNKVAFIILGVYLLGCSAYVTILLIYNFIQWLLT